MKRYRIILGNGMHVVVRAGSPRIAAQIVRRYHPNKKIAAIVAA